MNLSFENCLTSGVRAINHQHGQACAESASKCATRRRVEVTIFDLVILEINWKLHQAAGAQEVVGKKINPFFGF